MAEIISWLKVIGYVLVPIVLFLAVSRSVKNYKIKNGRLEIDQHSEKHAFLMYKLGMKPPK